MTFGGLFFLEKVRRLDEINPIFLFETEHRTFFQDLD